MPNGEKVRASSCADCGREDGKPYIHTRVGRPAGHDLRPVCLRCFDEAHSRIIPAATPAPKQRAARSENTNGGYNAAYLKSKYGLTPDDVARMRTAQAYRCAICGLDRRLYVDHDHVIGAVRGLLCAQCNNGLGVFRDDIACLARAIAYLQIANAAAAKEAEHG